MQDCGPFVDKIGRQYDVSEPNEANWCLKLSLWLRAWRQRVCYLKGSRVFFAVDWTTPPYDMINLLDPGVTISFVKKTFGRDHYMIDDCSTSRLKRYKLIFPDGKNEQWFNALLRNHVSELLFEACTHNDINTVMYLLTQEKVDVNYRRPEVRNLL